MAEAALEQMHDTIFNASAGLPADLRQELGPEILEQAAAAIAAGKGTQVEEREGEPESVPA